MRILGIDASTSTIGLAIIDYSSLNDAKLVFQQFYKPKKNISIFQKLLQIKIFLSSFLLEWKPDHIAIEDIILFMQGHSTAKTISSLSILNRTVGLTVLETLHQEPYLLSVMSIRHALKLNKKFPKKEEIPELVAHYLKIDFPYYYKKNKKNDPSNKVKSLKLTPKIAIESYDVADAIAVGLAFIKLQEKNKK